MDNDSDKAIVRRVLKGEVQLFAKIVERYERPIYNLMFRYCRSEQEAADMSQDVFLRIYNCLASFDKDKKFFPWLYTLAVNRANDWHRSNSLKRKKLAELQWCTPLIDTSSEQEKMLLNKESFAAMFKALDELTDTSREMILLRYQQELSITEIAEIFEVSVGAVIMKISRALQKMKSFLVGGDQLEKTINKSLAA